MKKEYFLYLGIASTISFIFGFVSILDIKVAKKIELSNEEKTLTVDLSQISSLNVSNIDEYFHLKVLAGENRKIMVDGKALDNTELKIQSNQSKDIIFDVQKHGKISKEKLKVFAYQKPFDKEIIKQIKSGKYQQIIGFTYTYHVSSGEKIFERDIFPYIDGRTHSFYYCGVTEPITIKIKSLQGQEFKILNHHFSSQDEFTLLPEQELPLLLELKKDTEIKNYKNKLSFFSKGKC